MSNITRRNALGLLGSMAALGLAACGGNSESDTADDSASKTYRIGILQLTQHEALDASHDGFVDGLDESGISYEITSDLNASGDQSACQTAAQTLVNDGNDLILAIATPAVEACAGATEEIPIVGTAVTDFAESGLVDSNDAPGGNITG
jgi:putative ABC transport system substrate-binding protein